MKDKFLRVSEQDTTLSLLDHFSTWFSERIESRDGASLAGLKVASTIFVPPAALRKAKTKKAMAANGLAKDSAAVTTAASPIAAAMPAEAELPSPIVTPLDAQWLFSLLSVLDQLLSSSEISILRSLARTCLDVADMTHEWETKHVAADDGKKAEWKDCIAGCWMVVSVVWEVWGQRDLWDG